MRGGYIVILSPMPQAQWKGYVYIKKEKAVTMWASGRAQKHKKQPGGQGHMTERQGEDQSDKISLDPGRKALSDSVSAMACTESGRKPLES